MSELLSAHTESLSLLRRLYCEASIDEQGSMVIPAPVSGELSRTILMHIGRLERVIANELKEPK